MNYAQYLQQGGQTPSIEEQVVSLVQAAMQGDQLANDQINQIMLAAKQGDQKALQLALLIQQVAQKLQGAQPEAMKCGGKVRAKVKKACGGKKLEEGDKILKAKKGCPCSLKKVGGRLIEVDCNGIPVAKNGAVLYAEPGDKMPDMKLPSRSFGDNMRIKWDNFKNGVKDFALLRNEEARIRNIGLGKQGGQLNYSQYMQLGTPKNGIQKLDTAQVDKTTPEKENYSVRKTVVETLPTQGKYIPSLRDSMVYYTRPDGGEYFTEYINGKPYYETDARNGAGRAINHDLNSSKSDTTYYNWSIPVHWEISQENLKRAYNGSPQPRYQYIGVENIGDR